MKFETVQIYFLSEFLVCCHPKNLLPWQHNLLTSLLPINIENTTPFSNNGTLMRTKCTQLSTMGKKTWLSMHPRNFGSDKIVHMYVCPPLHVSWGDILHFKHSARLAVNHMATRAFGEEKQQGQVFLSTKF